MSTDGSESLYVKELAPCEEELTEFKNRVKIWTDLDKNIKLLSIAIRERRKAQSVLTPKIQDFMIKYKYDHLNTTNDGTIRSSVRMIKQSPKIAEVKKKIADELGEETVKKIFVAEPTIIEKRRLVRTTPKVSMDLNI